MNSSGLSTNGSADGRFAPSPTGPLHLGSLRTALVAWLFARSQRARFLVRIEDLDPQRSRREWEARQLADLSALGLDWDGEPVRQSERADVYAEALARLDRDGRLYPCFCTRAEIREAASAPHGALPEGAYPGTCATLAPEEVRSRIAAGRPYALRVRAQREVIEFEDRLAGRHAGTVDDFVVRRADGVTAYQLAVVVDDADQGIGEVVRGADLLDSTPRQILLSQPARPPGSELRPRTARARAGRRAARETPSRIDARPTATSRSRTRSRCSRTRSASLGIEAGSAAPRSCSTSSIPAGYRERRSCSADGGGGAGQS